MKAVVFAYHDMGCVGVEALIEAGFDIAAIFTHLDNPSENHFYGSVAHLAAEHNIPVFSPDNVNHPLWVERLRESAPDIIFSFYYRDLLSEEILSIPPAGAYNLHGSLLPRYRGRAPLNWVLVNGETETGVTLHKMVKRADAGGIVSQQRVAIADSDDALRLHKKLTQAARELLQATLPAISQGNVTLSPRMNTWLLTLAAGHRKMVVLTGISPRRSYIIWYEPSVSPGRGRSVMSAILNLSSGNHGYIPIYPRRGRARCCPSLRW